MYQYCTCTWYLCCKYNSNYNSTRRVVLVAGIDSTILLSILHSGSDVKKAVKFFEVSFLNFSNGVTFTKITITLVALFFELKFF